MKEQVFKKSDLKNIYIHVQTNKRDNNNFWDALTVLILRSHFRIVIYCTFPPDSRNPQRVFKGYAEIFEQGNE